MKRIKIGSQTVETVSIGELAKLCNRQADTLRKLEQVGLFPPANWRLGGFTVKKGPMAGEDVEGFRIYTTELASKVAEVFKTQIRQGSKISEEVRGELWRIFKEEKDKYS